MKGEFSARRGDNEVFLVDAREFFFGFPVQSAGDFFQLGDLAIGIELEDIFTASASV